MLIKAKFFFIYQHIFPEINILNFIFYQHNLFKQDVNNEYI